ncbi:MAG: UDP-N-acetylglucosamine 2-epimerase (non-hydrolyzing) [Chitinivibrionales bacterium]|nr:UDP-N-acetylglucosamine 2-epimerase (non-hydrolyzing) [Chitinivibrionales bacterium]
MQIKPTIAVVFGTRPEAVKMVPVIKALKKIKSVNTVSISTGQHREMLKPILNRFKIAVDYEMDLMEPNQTLYRLSSKAISAFEDVLLKSKPSLLLVQGDTTTAFLGALCAYYGKIPVGHVEAGLRTDNKYFPFPEEINRRLITAVADLNFAPTEGNKRNLIREGNKPETIYVTGNTGIDTLVLASRFKAPPVFPGINLKNKRIVLVTIHRRESFGDVMEGIFHGLRDIAERYKDVELVYPVHLNPNVRKPAYAILGKVRNIHLVEPMEYFDFVNAMKNAYLILTDSGGIQEEAPTLGVPVLVARNETERPEAVKAGTVRLVGTSRKKIVTEACKILDHKKERLKLTQAANPYGDGRAAPRIAKQCLRFINCMRSEKTA